MRENALLEVVQAREAQRQALARELEMRLPAPLRLQQKQAALYLAQPGPAAPAVQVLARMSARAQSELRELIADLSASELRDLGLLAGLESLAERWARRLGLAVIWQPPSGQARREVQARLAGEDGLGLAVFRVTQAALAFASQESAASRVEISLDWLAGELRLSVADDGQAGGPPPDALQEWEQQVQVRGGSITFARLAGVGAQLRADFPPPAPAPAQPHTPPAEALTGRETDVLRGVLAGLTNRQIAARLKISDRTVQYHLSNILTKLSAASRTEAAVLALGLGLTPMP